LWPFVETACSLIKKPLVLSGQEFSQRDALWNFLIKWRKTARDSLLFLGEQIRAVSPCLFDSYLPPPFVHFRVVSADQNFGHFPAAILRRPRVMRKIE
jgi:hypothetical protein